MKFLKQILLACLIIIFMNEADAKASENELIADEDALVDARRSSGRSSRSFSRTTTTTRRIKTAGYYRADGVYVAPVYYSSGPWNMMETIISIIVLIIFLVLYYYFKKKGVIEDDDDYHSGSEVEVVTTTVV